MILNRNIAYLRQDMLRDAKTMYGFKIHTHAFFVATFHLSKVF